LENGRPSRPLCSGQRPAAPIAQISNSEGRGKRRCKVAEKTAKKKRVQKKKKTKQQKRGAQNLSTITKENVVEADKLTGGHWKQVSRKLRRRKKEGVKREYDRSKRTSQLWGGVYCEKPNPDL